MWINRTNQYWLQPSKSQERVLLDLVEARRQLWNHARAYIMQEYTPLLEKWKTESDLFFEKKDKAKTDFENKNRQSSEKKENNKLGRGEKEPLKPKILSQSPPQKPRIKLPESEPEKLYDFFYNKIKADIASNPANNDLQKISSLSEHITLTVLLSLAQTFCKENIYKILIKKYNFLKKEKLIKDDNNPFSGKSTTAKKLNQMHEDRVFEENKTIMNAELFKRIYKAQLELENSLEKIEKDKNIPSQKKQSDSTKSRTGPSKEQVLEKYKNKIEKFSLPKYQRKDGKQSISLQCARFINNKIVPIITNHTDEGEFKIQINPPENGKKDGYVTLPFISKNEMFIKTRFSRPIPIIDGKQAEITHFSIVKTQKRWLVNFGHAYRIKNPVNEMKKEAGIDLGTDDFIMLAQKKLNGKIEKRILRFDLPAHYNIRKKARNNTDSNHNKKNEYKNIEDGIPKIFNAPSDEEGKEYKKRLLNKWFKINKQIEVLQRKMEKCPKKPEKNQEGEITEKASQKWLSLHKKLVNKLLKKKNMRHDFFHKLSTFLSKNYKTIYIEDIDAQSMSKSIRKREQKDFVNFKEEYKNEITKIKPEKITEGQKINIENKLRNKYLRKGFIQKGKEFLPRSKLNRANIEASCGDFSKILRYKLEQNGGELIVVNKKNSSKYCSKCNQINKEIKDNHGKIFKCPNCEHTENNDANASRVILNWGANTDLSPNKAKSC